MTFSCNKKMLSIFLLLSCLLLSACDLTNAIFDAQIHDPLDTNNAPDKTITSASTPATTEQTQETTTDPEQLYELQIIGLEKNLIIEILDFLNTMYIEYDMPEDSFAIKINKIKKDGLQPLHVKFDVENYYYACAYYNPTHEHPDYEKYEFCCANDYTWVKFDTPDQITDQYQGLAFVCAFQVNRAVFCHDIGQTEGTSKNMEHYLRYAPEFADGSNTADASVFDKCLIYLNSSELETAYFTAERQYHNWIAMHCMELDGQYYVPYYTHMQYADGTVGTRDLEWHFGEYYEYVMSIMVTGKYNVPDEYGRTAYYGLISVEEIANIISE